jgi:ApbE superfamily uncharacterized protein (UPF0280 family)
MNPDIMKARIAALEKECNELSYEANTQCVTIEDQTIVIKDLQKVLAHLREVLSTRNTQLDQAIREAHGFRADKEFLERARQAQDEIMKRMQKHIDLLEFVVGPIVADRTTEFLSEIEAE